MTASLCVSIVTYAPVEAGLRGTVRTLSAALHHARASGILAGAEVVLVDNGPGSSYGAPLASLLDAEVRPPLRARLISGHGNVGFGRGHNLAWRAAHADFHLVLNPDVALAPDAIDKALQYLVENPRVVVLAPEARGRSGERLYLCKRYPSVLDLALRGFAPAALRRSFRARLERYEMRDVLGERPVKGVPIVSGSFMFCRRPTLEALGGFSEDFFLYFEDFDLSLRAGRLGELAWVPSVRIVHFGGEAARKGWRHVWFFARSAVTFFNRHGWKWA